MLILHEKTYAVWDSSLSLPHLHLLITTSQMQASVSCCTGEILGSLSPFSPLHGLLGVGVQNEGLRRQCFLQYDSQCQTLLENYSSNIKVEEAKIFLTSLAAAMSE